VLVSGVQFGGLHVQRYPPAARMLGDRGEQDFGPVLGQHAPQPAGVVMHADLPDTGQCDRAGPLAVADANRRWLVLGVFVAQPKRRHGTASVFFLNRGNPILLPLRLPERESDQALSSLPRSTAASSKTCWHTSSRQA